MWLYFTAVKSGNKKFGQCNDVKCKAHTDPQHFCLLSDRSTQPLWRHLRSFHPEISKEEIAIQTSKKANLDKLKEDAAKKMSEFVFKPNSQLIMTEYTKNNGPKYQNAHPVQKKFNRNFKNMLINDAQPFKMANSPWFKQLMFDVDPRIKVNDRSTYSRFVRKEGKVVKRRAREHVRRNVCLGYAASVDMWRSNAGEDYLGLIHNS